METAKPPIIRRRLNTNESAGGFPAVLIIIDGFGYAAPGSGNAITLARTPVLRRLMARHPWTLLQASGTAVGLPDGQEGNSEAGHMNLAAGRIVEQDQIHISRRITDGRFFKNSALVAALRHSVHHHGSIHLMGMLSNGQSAHSSPDHLLALLTYYRAKKAKRIFLHLFTDGRDSPPTSSLLMVQKLEVGLRPNEQIATISGRFWAMDRKKDWPRTKQTYDAMTLGKGNRAASASEAIASAYHRGVTDEFIEPTVIMKRRRPVAVVKNSDSLIFFNLRSDRARQLTKAFVQRKFNWFIRRKPLPRLFFVAMTDFGPDLENVVTAFPSPNLTGTLTMALRRYRQLYIAENEKFAHVTYFFNGGYADPVAGEERIMVPSPDVSSYDQRPEMSANEITDIVLKKLEAREYDFISLNFANPDMVAHTGNLAATITAVETVDNCVGRIAAVIERQRGSLFIVGDHGNAEGLINPDNGAKDTEHSTCPVPFIADVTGRFAKRTLGNSGVLGQVAPTILDTLGATIPMEMNLPSLWR